MKKPVQSTPPNSLTPANLLIAFRSFINTLGLSSISRKLYLADINRFLSSKPELAYSISLLSNPKTYLEYLKRPELTSSSTLTRRTLSSLRQFGTFLSTAYQLKNPTTSLSVTPGNTLSPLNDVANKYIKAFTKYLNSIHLGAQSIKSYKSDISQYLLYLDSHHPSNHVSTLLNEKNLQKYTDELSHSLVQSPATIQRKTKTIRRFITWVENTKPQIIVSDNTQISANSLTFESLSPIDQASDEITVNNPNLSTSSHTISPDDSDTSVKNNNYRKIWFSSLKKPPLRSLLTASILLVIVSTLSILTYRQFGSEARLTAAFPSTPITPNRQLSFQGRLENASGTPITSATNFVFKLYDASSGGTELYSTGTCSITPDSDGVFSTQIGSTCGAGIGSGVFTENADVWLEVTVAAETLTPRQQIATVAYALNSETLQGFPLSATVSAIRNTVVPMNQYGEIIIGEQSPKLTGVAGTFQISAPSLSLVTAAGTNGNITLAPDGTGQVNVNGNTTTTNFFNISNAQLTTGSLITGSVANNNTGFKLIDLLSGSSPTSKFSVTDAGNVTLAGDLTITGDDLFMTTNTSGYLLIADGTNYNPVGVSGDITINSSGVTAIGNDKITESMLKAVNSPTDELCLSYESTVGDFEWQTCGSGSGGSSNWRLNAGTISPNNDTLDLLIGANATASAKAGFININSGTPTATVSAGGTSGAFLTAAGTLGTTAKKSLTLGNSTTGNVVIAPGGVTALTAIGANLVAAGNLTLTTAANLIFGTTSLNETTAANDSGAYLVGTFDEFANSNGANVQDVLDDLDASLTTALTGASLWSDAGTYLYPTSAEVLGNSTSGGANKLAGIYLGDTSPLVFGTDNDVSFSFSGSTLGSTLTSGSMIGINTTTALATLDVRSSLGTIPVASIAGSTSQAALIVDNTVGDLFTASSSGLSRFVITQNGNVGIGVTAPTSKLEIGGATSTISNNSGDITIDAASDFISFASDSIGNILNGYFAGEIGIGLTNATGLLHVQGATTGKALAILDELGDQDLLTASGSGVTRFRLTNSGSLSLDGDYLNFGLTDGTSGYGFRDNGGTLQFKHNSGSWADVGSGGASWWDQTSGTLQPYNKTVDLLLGGAATSSAKIALININSGTPTATLSAGTSGGVYIDATGKIATTAKQTLALGDSTTTGNIILQGGNVGIGVASPTEKLEVNGYVVAQRFVDSANSAYYLDAASTGTSLSIEGNIVGNGAFYLSTGNDAVAVSIGTTGAGKLDAGTIDPPYTINGEKFATYMSSMTGVKEETTGTVSTQELVPGKGYRAILDFANALTGSDLWLFAQTSNLKTQLDKLVVLTTAAGSARTWYEVDALNGQVHLYSQTPTLISYRLTAPRFDAANWSNTRDSNSTGFVINTDPSWSVSSQIANFYNQLISPAETNLISPLASDSGVIITKDPSLPPNTLPSGQSYDNQEDPLLLVDGTLDVATISARTAYLNNVVADTITARDIVADTITANTIIGLDAKIASLSGISDAELESVTTRIKDRLSNLLTPVTAEDLPAPAETTPDINLDLAPSSTSSATLTNADIDFATINQYLAVIGQATITTLDVTSDLFVSSINSKTGLLTLQPLGGIINLANNTLIVDSNGSVSVNGNLTVSGTIQADNARINQLDIGNPLDASSSALGNLLAIYNEQGQAVATINASGSANLASLTTNMITIASSGTASDSSALSDLVGTTKSNATAGVATLITPNTELTITSPFVTPNSLVYLTPTTNTDNKVLFVQSKVTCSEATLTLDPNCTPSFTVGIDNPATTNISFNWWIIELAPTKNPVGDQQI